MPTSMQKRFSNVETIHAEESHYVLPGLFFGDLRNRMSVPCLAHSAPQNTRSVRRWFLPKELARPIIIIEASEHFTLHF